MPSKARQGVEALLKAHPEAEIQRIDNQGTHAWTIVDLYEGPEIPTHTSERLNLYNFAVWNFTGNVYDLLEDGSVAEDPIIFITPWPEAP